jgi:intracellular multiplication protein IcmB
MIASSIREFPILSSITKFDIAGARVCAIDLAEVAPQGDQTADRQTAIMYMLARHTLVRSWWLGEDALKNMPSLVVPYHAKRLQNIRESAKRICYDEFHRTSRSHAVRAQVIRDVREGRKWGVQIALSSQLLDDFTNDMVDLATGVWILGSALSDRAVNFSVERFGLSDTARWIMRNRLTGPRAGGAPALFILGTNEGRFEQFLINTLGPIGRCPPRRRMSRSAAVSTSASAATGPARCWRGPIRGVRRARNCGVGSPCTPSRAKSRMPHSRW